MRELKLNKQQFVVFNDDDQFQLFSDDEGSPDYEDFDAEVDKLFLKYDCIIIDEEDYIYGEKNGKRELIAPDSFEAFDIATEVLDDNDDGYSKIQQDGVPLHLEDSPDDDVEYPAEFYFSEGEDDE